MYSLIVRTHFDERASETANCIFWVIARSRVSDAGHLRPASTSWIRSSRHRDWNLKTKSIIENGRCNRRSSIPTRRELKFAAQVRVRKLWLAGQAMPKWVGKEPRLTYANAAGSGYLTDPMIQSFGEALVSTGQPRVAAEILL
jgi:hypothetical protein